MFIIYQHCIQKWHLVLCSKLKCMKWYKEHKFGRFTFISYVNLPWILFSSPGKTGTPVLLHFSFFAATELSRNAVCSKATVKLRIRMVGSTELTRWRRRIKKNIWLFYEEGPAGRKRVCAERTQANEGELTWPFLSPGLFFLLFLSFAHVLLIFSI